MPHLRDFVDSGSFPSYAEKALKIITMEGKLQYLNLNMPQMKVHSILGKQQDAGLPMRAIILKARREGVCLSPDTKILTADLRWLEISEIPVGIPVMSVDENSPIGRGNQRRLRKSIIEKKREIIAPTFKLYMEDGRSLIATGQHRFLCLQRGGTYTQWRSVNKIKIGDYIRHVSPVWGEPNFLDGWMGGLLDGEGTIRPKTRAGCEVSISQCFGGVYDKAKQYLIDNKYAFREDIDKRQGHCKDGYKRKPMGRLVLGRLDEIFRLIGKTRPVRLLGKDYWEGKELPGKGAGNEAWIKITWIEPTGIMPVFDLQTSHKTFIAEGFVSHNSTYFEARYFREINRMPMRYACVCSADTDATDKVFKMASLFQQEISEDLRRPTDYSNRKEIVYSAPHRSQFLCQTAGKDVLGRGGLTHYLHATEFAFWNNAKSQFGGAAQEIPDDPETIIALESTANGTGGAFYDMYVDAVERWKHTKSLDGYIPIFLPWFIFDYYRRKPPEFWKPTEEEIAIQIKFKLDIEQLYWRHWAIENKCQGDLRLFKQEYPATWLEAFQSTGNPVFTPGMISFQEDNIRDDYKVGLFDPRTGTFEEHPGIPYGWKYLDQPSSGTYAIGVDTKEYTLSDKKDERSDRDYDGAIVLERKFNRRRVMAKWFGRAIGNDLGPQLIGAGKHYNMAYIGVEIPKGIVELKTLVDARYPNLYQQRTKEAQLSPEETEELGIRVTTLTRPYLITNLISHFQANGIVVQFQDILNQMRTFIWDKDGKPRHMPGKKDDDIFALAHALETDLSCPKPIELGEIPDRTGDYEAGERYRGKTIADLAKVGAVDDIDEFGDDDDDYWHTD